jgi:hypothetical protein
MVIGAIDETGQEKAGEATAGVKRQYMGARAGWQTGSTRSTCRTCGPGPGTRRSAPCGCRKPMPPGDTHESRLRHGHAAGPRTDPGR